MEIKLGNRSDMDTCFVEGKLTEEFGSPIQEFGLEGESGTSISYIDDGQTFDW